ncbi:MAG: PilZ domain-containing protein [Vicinamibacterales bacterium]
MNDVNERRRTPRIELQHDEDVRLELRHRVQLMDISQTGALVGCETALPVGTRGQIRIGLGPEPFSAEVAVKRHHPKSARRGQVGLGTMFGSMDDRSKRQLEQFLQRAKD